jgi:hypothetical protein
MDVSTLAATPNDVAERPRRFLHAHHVRHWSHGGSTDLGNLVQLCRHHHGLVHEGGYRLGCDSLGTLTFTRPDGGVIPASPSGARGRPAQVVEKNRSRDLRITADTCGSRWDGSGLDLPVAVDGLIQSDTRLLE